MPALSQITQAKDKPQTMDMQGTFWKAIATTVVWTMLTVGFALAFIFVGENLGEDIIALAFFMLVAAVLVSGFIWNWGRTDSTQQTASEAIDSEVQFREKRKNDRLGQALRDLSNDELMRLRQRLASGEIDERDLEAALGEEADRLRL